MCSATRKRGSGSAWSRPWCRSAPAKSSTRRSRCTAPPAFRSGRRCRKCTPTCATCASPTAPMKCTGWWSAATSCSSTEHQLQTINVMAGLVPAIHVLWPGSHKQVSQDHKNSNLCGEPTDRPYTCRRKRIGRNIQQTGDDEHPSPDDGQRPGGVGCMHQKKSGNELWKYLEQISVRTNKAPADTGNLTRFV